MPKFYVLTIDELPGVFFRGLVVGAYKPDCAADMTVLVKKRPRVKLPRATRHFRPNRAFRPTSGFPPVATGWRTSRNGSLVPTLQAFAFTSLRRQKGYCESHFARQGMRVRVAFYECTRFGNRLMAWSEEDIVRALARVGTKGLTAAALAKAISAPASNKQLSSAITKLKSRGAIRGPFRIGRSSLFFEAKSAPTRESLESRIEDVLRRAGTRVTTRSDLDKCMKGVVQSLYKDAISALKGEGKIVELRNARRSPLYVHRDAIIDQLRLESGGDLDRRPPPSPPTEPTPISLEDVRPYYLAIKAEQGGISTVKIYDILKKLGVSKDKLHALLLHEAKRGRVSLHAASTVNFPHEVMEAGIRIEGEQQPYVTFILREAS
jgi:hypothetical protein